MVPDNTTMELDIETMYKSAQIIFAQENKDLYLNVSLLYTFSISTKTQRFLLQTLETLTLHLKRCPPSSDNRLLDAQHIRVYLLQVLPLCFISDAILQGKAILTIDAALDHLLLQPDYDQLAEWPAIKSTISEQYFKRLQTMRDSQHPNWHVVLSILMRVIHKDILRSATSINRFLSILDGGFHSPNLTVRAETFLCWYHLVRLFAMHGQFSKPHRIELLCIPLKTVKARSEQMAVNKFNVWWLLLNELHDQIADFTDSIVAPFLVYCFGQGSNSRSTAPGEMFQKLTPMAISALICLLGEPNEAVAAMIECAQMLRLKRPVHSAALFARSGWALINSAGKASLLIARLTDNEQRNAILTCLWRHVIEHVNTLQSYAHFELMLKNMVPIEVLHDFQDVVNAFARRLGGEQLIRMYGRLKRLHAQRNSSSFDCVECTEFRNIMQQHVHQCIEVQTLIKNMSSDGDEGGLRLELMDMLVEQQTFVSSQKTKRKAVKKTVPKQLRKSKQMCSSLKSNARNRTIHLPTIYESESDEKRNTGEKRMRLKPNEATINIDIVEKKTAMGTESEFVINTKNAKNVMSIEMRTMALTWDVWQ